MNHYYKGKNTEEVLSRETVPFTDLPETWTWSEMTGASKVRSEVGSLSKSLRQDKCLVVSGSGAHVNKVVTVAEIIKRRQKHVDQRIELGERVVQEYWEPKDGDEGLDSLVVTRRIPTIHIVLDINKHSSPVSPDDQLCAALWEKNQSSNKKQKT